MWCCTRINFESTALLLSINGIPQSVNSKLLSYADDFCIAFQHEDIKTIQEHLNRNCSTLIDCLVDNKLSLKSGDDKTETILSRYRSKTVGQIYIFYKDVKIKQYSKVTHLGCVLNQ